MKIISSLRLSDIQLIALAVARLEFTPSIPIFAKVEVNAAKTADNIANTAHNYVFPSLCIYMPDISLSLLQEASSALRSSHSAYASPVPHTYP